MLKSRFIFPLIPRVRVNYNFAQILRALFISERKDKYRLRLIFMLSEFFGTKNIYLTSSGRGGLFWLLKSLPQTKVIIPAYTCSVVAEAVLIAGKKLIFAPTSDATFNTDYFDGIDSDTIVIATHQYGFPCDIEAIAQTCVQKGTILIEDCAGAFGTKINGRLAGSFGDYSFFSFDSSKLLNCPSKGGFIIAKDNNDFNSFVQKSSTIQNNIGYKLKHLARGAIYCLLKNKVVYRCFHYLTMGRKGNPQLPGHEKLNLELGDFYQYGFYEWQAYFIVKQLTKINDIVTKRKHIFEYYNKEINNDLIVKPQTLPHACCIRYPILVKNKYVFYNQCLRLGVDFGFSFDHIASPENWTIEHEIASCILNVPFYYNLTEHELQHIVQVLNALQPQKSKYTTP